MPESQVVQAFLHKESQIVPMDSTIFGPVNNILRCVFKKEIRSLVRSPQVARLETFSDEGRARNIYAKPYGKTYPPFS